MKNFGFAVGALTYLAAIGASYAAPTCEQLKSVAVLLVSGGGAQHPRHERSAENLDAASHVLPNPKFWEATRHSV